MKRTNRHKSRQTDTHRNTQTDRHKSRHTDKQTVSARNVKVLGSCNQPLLILRSRVKFMLETILAIRNNNMRKIPNYDPTHLEHLRKLIRNYVRGALVRFIRQFFLPFSILCFDRVIRQCFLINLSSNTRFTGSNLVLTLDFVDSSVLTMQHCIAQLVALYQYGSHI